MNIISITKKQTSLPHGSKYFLSLKITENIFVIFRMTVIKKSESSLADYMGYISTWSAYQKLCNEDKVQGENLLKDTEKE